MPSSIVPLCCGAITQLEPVTKSGEREPAFTKMSWLLRARWTIVRRPGVSYLTTSNGSRFKEQPMLKTIALIGLAAALALPSAPAFAVNGDSSSYGTEGYGPTVPTQSLTPFQRSWNHANESKERARAGAAWLRHHGGYGRYHRSSQSGGAPVRS